MEHFSALSNPEVLGALNQEASQSSSKSSLQSEPPPPVRTERKWQWAYPQIEGVPPTSRGGHTATLVDTSLIIFGGHYYAGKSQGFVYLNDCTVLDVNENRWFRPRLSGTPPAPRYGHTAVLAGSRIVVFGGRGSKGAHFRDLHALDPSTMTWYQGPEGGNAPSGRLGHSANLVGSRMFVFGGWNNDQYFNDLFVLDLGMMAWTQPETSGPVPGPRMGHVTEVIGTNIIVQGGFYFEEEKKKECGLRMGSMLKECYLNDLRVLDTEALVWSRLRVSGTPPRHCFWHTMDISGSDIIVFGGYGAFQKTPNNESDYFVVLNTDSMSWNRPTFTGIAPPPRHGHTSTAIGAHVLIFGGWEASKAMNDVIVIRDLSALAKKSDD